MFRIFVSILLLLGLNGLYAENGWSDPKLISTGSFNITPNIVVDKTGMLHAFWSKADSIMISNHGCIMHSYSADDGLHWSVPVNVSENTTDRPITPVAMVDSDNNLHLVYHNIYNNQIWYRQQQNGIWQAPEMVTDYSNSELCALIDKNDCIYISWLEIGLKQSFYRIKSSTGNWTEKKLLHDEVFSTDICYDGNNTIHISGTNNTDLTVPTNKAYYMEYKIDQDSIVSIVDISDNLRPSQAHSIACVKNGQEQFFTALNVGIYSDTSATYSVNKKLNSWQIPEKVAQKTYIWDKQIVVDSGANPHLFDLSLKQDTLFHYTRNSSGWNKENVVHSINSDIDMFMNGSSAVVNNDNLYLSFRYSVTGISSKIYFMKKHITVSMEENYELRITNYELANYPNPFNNNTKISFVLPQISEVKLEIFNAMGELVKSLVNNLLKSGKHSYSFNATALNSGVYYCRLSVGSEVKTTKLMLLK